MKKFIFKTLWWFLLPFFLLMISFEILSRNIPNDYALKRAFLDTYASGLNTLILGSSHSLYGINPEYFEQSTFNAAHVSQSLDYDLEILEKYQDSLINLKTIILPVSYFTLFSRLEAGAEDWRIKNYIIYYGINSSLTVKYYFETTNATIKNMLKRLIDYYLRGESSVTCTTAGWSTAYRSSDAEKIMVTGIGAAKRHTKYGSKQYHKLFKENILLLEEIILWSKKRNIKILLLLPPAFKTYRENLNRVQLTTTVATCQKLKEYHKNCEYINLLDSDLFINEDFYDADHLSAKGAEKLSRLLNEIINK